MVGRTPISGQPLLNPGVAGAAAAAPAGPTATPNIPEPILRLFMERFGRPPTPEEIEQLRLLIQQQGALGPDGGAPVPNGPVPGPAPRARPRFQIPRPGR
jgi:hypothetical protein